MSKVMKTDVLIVGAGPCGALLANLLGHYGIKTLLIDSSEDIIDYPRAVGIDDESLRSLQMIGLAEQVLKDCIQDVPLRLFTRTGKVFAHIEPKAKEFGWCRRNIFMQPELEATLRENMKSYSSVTLKTGRTLKRFVQKGDVITAMLEGPKGETYSVNARFLVGTDGGRSTVRKQSNISFEGQTHERKWLVIDVKNDQLNAFYTGLHGDPKRPWLSVWLPKNYRRWEFMMFDGEDDNDLLDDAKIESLMRGKLPGKESLDVARARIYTHHSRTAETFQKGHVFLAGDSAHLTEPWIGQGLNSGLRDVTNLAWKLKMVINGSASSELLTTYTTERREHAKDMTRLARQFGAIFAMTNPIKAFFRDVFFMSIKNIGWLRRYVTEFKFKPMPRYSKGFVLRDMLANKKSPVGRMFVQPVVRLSDGTQVKLDNLLGKGFAVLGVGINPVEYLSKEQQKFWSNIGCEFIMVGRKGRLIPQVDAPVTAIEDFDGVFYKVTESEKWPPIYIIRPDRYVAAQCNLEELDGVMMRLMEMLKAD